MNTLTSWLTDPVALRSERKVARLPEPPRTDRRLPSPLTREPVEIFRDGQDRIIHVRIGRWRVLAASARRRIAEVRQLACRRVAVRIEQHEPRQLFPSGTIWELYDHSGCLLTMLQQAPGQEVWLSTDFAAGDSKSADRREQTSLLA